MERQRKCFRQREKHIQHRSMMICMPGNGKCLKRKRQGVPGVRVILGAGRPGDGFSHRLERTKKQGEPEGRGTAMFRKEGM